MDNPFGTAVMIVAIIALADVVIRYLKTKTKLAELAGDASKIDARLAKIEARLGTLETVVVDGDIDLKRQFRDLERE